MARAIAKLTAKAVAAAKPGMRGDGGGLWLHTSASGARSWIFRFRSPVDGRQHEMGLGSTITVTLAEARAKALASRHLLLDGVDPLASRQTRRAAARREAARAMTFKQAAEAYIADNRAGWKNAKHAAQWPSTLEAYAYPLFGALPVRDIDEGLIVKALRPIWTTKTETATRVRQRVEAVLDWATVRKFREGANPARWQGCLESLLPAPGKMSQVAHHPALPFAEIGGFIADLQKQNGVAPRCLEFAILTAARTSEAIGAVWSEIDEEARLWTVPAGRMKAGREHRAPLSAPALAILRALPRGSEFLFAGQAGRPISNMSMLMLLRRMGRRDLTVHGFRSSFRDWAAERTGFPAEVAEMALAHAVADKVEAAYRRGDLFAKRRQLADAWAKFCTAPAPPGEVVPLVRYG
jgi:integrase